MNRSISRRTKSDFTQLALSALLLSLCVSPVLAQGAKKPAPATPQSQSQQVDREYTDSIIKNTTDKMFLTEFVDHLPASDKVPSPDKVLGYAMGTPNKLTYTKDQYRYYRELEKATPRVKVFTAPEKSEEGREQLLVVVGDEASIAKLRSTRRSLRSWPIRAGLTRRKRSDSSAKARRFTGPPVRSIHPKPAARRC